VAHEIRNPLSAIRMNVQLLEREAEEGREYFHEILEEIDRLDLVVDSLLDSTARWRSNPQPKNLNEVISSALRLTSRRLDHLGIEVHTSFSEDIPPLALDVKQMRQAVLNIVLNAAEAMPGGGKLRVSTARAGDAVEAVFEDTGVGLPRTVGERVFEPFFSTKERGAGLGLYIVRKIVELHGGSVRLEATFPSGTRCVLRITPAPAAQSPAPIAV
jgi:signal transduction histidine kinase